LETKNIREEKRATLIDITTLSGLSEYRHAAKVLLSFTNNKHLLYDEDAIAIALSAIIFSQSNYDQTQGTLFSFATNNVRKFIYRYSYGHTSTKRLKPLPRKIEHSPLSLLIIKEEQERIGRIIDSLPDKKRRCVELYYYDGLNLTSIAQELHISIEYVRQILLSLKEEFNVIWQERKDNNTT
jgi:RNA polymerase sigma factor (sigma-70 family)